VRPLILLLILGLCACKGAAPDEPTFSEAVKAVYKPCDPDELKLRAAAKGMQLAFEPCGSNNFSWARWSPDGLTLYYQASQGGWVRRDTGENYPLRIGVPRSNPAWLNGEMLAYPDGDGRKIGIYQVRSHVLNLVELNVVNPEQLCKGAANDEVLFLASDVPEGNKDVYRFSADTGETERAFPWLAAGVETFTYAPALDTVCYREFASEDVVCRKGADGADVVEVKGRKRGVLSADGRYLVTEGDGAPVPVYGDDEEGRARSAAAPTYIPKEIVPPSFWIRDMATGAEVLWTGVHGHAFQWYDAAPYFGSFLLWGFDGVETNTNVTLVDLRSFLKGQGWDVPIGAEKARNEPATRMD
jgi:hypothetical protein